jgi:hypothetical protein
MAFPVTSRRDDRPMIRLVAAASALALGLLLGGVAAAGKCARDYSDLYRERGPGPFALVRVDCRTWDGERVPEGPPVLAPDGKSLAAYGYGKGLFAGDLAGKVRSYPVNLGVSADFAGGAPAGPDAAFAWSRDSATLWTAVQKRQAPRGGWALGPMRPVRAMADGTLRALPALTHRAGPLDGLLWIGRDGLALAQFGTRGGYYRPEHKDRAPTLAFVDAARGRVIEARPLKALVPDLNPGFSPSVSMLGADAVLLGDGRARAVIRGLAQWAVWTQGAAPRLFANPYRGERVETALSPDGRTLLVKRELPSQTVCPRAPPCRIGPVIRGPIASLIDLGTGKPRWTLDGAGAWGSGSGEPLFTPDGRHALVPLPRNGGSDELAVISVADGRLVQKLAGRGGSNAAAGFLASGQFWMGTAYMTAFYAYRP